MDIFKELEVLKGKKLISSEQYDKLLIYYKKNEAIEKKAGGNKFVTILSIIGAVLVGVGLILFFSSNWDAMSDVFKTSLLIGVMLAVYGAGIWLYFFKEYPKLGYALILLGTMVYGANIFLLGQIYNIGGSYIDAFGLWALGALAVGYAVGLGGVTTFGLVLGYIYLWVYLAERNMFDVQLIPLFLSFFGMGIAALGARHKGIYQSFKKYFVSVGVLSLIVSVFWMTFKDYEVPPTLVQDVFHSGWLLLVILFALLVENSKWLFKPSLILNPFYNLHFVFWLLVSLVGPLYSGTTWFILAVNIYFMGLLIHLIYRGIKTDNSWLVNFGIFFFLVFIIARYFDLFSDMLGGGLFFVVGGLILLVSGYFLEKFRRKLLAHSL